MSPIELSWTAKNEEQNPEGLDYRTAAQDDIDTGSQHELTMDFPELRMTRVHLSNCENIEDINSGQEGHGMEQSRGCRGKDEWAGHQLGLVHLSCPSPLPPCAPLHHHRSPTLPKLY